MPATRSYKCEKVLERLHKKVNRQVLASLEACVHCGMCTDQCHYVLANPGDVTYMPSYKADKLRKFFKAHIDWTGRVFPWWAGAKDLYTDQELEELRDVVFGKCTNCRRCSVNCPMGVDMATFNRMARGLLVSVGIMPEGVSVVAKDQWEIGNQMGVLREEYLDTLAWMEEELQDELEEPNIKIPVDKMDSDVVYSINPREAKYDPRTIADAAKIFHYAGEDWTMASEGWDMTNFGLFNGDDELGGAVARRCYEATENLRGKKLVISECGHGYRSTRCEGQNWGQHDVPFEMESSVLTMLRYIKEGRIKVDKTKNPEPVTFHDSCNNARSCGLTEEPRELLNLVCMDFREMYPNRAENFCCTGGGGAMSMSEYTPQRLKSARIKANQIMDTGAKIVVTSCHNCVDGLADLIKHYDLGVDVTQLVNLVANTLVMPEKKVIPVEAEKPAEAPALAGYKILIADDEPDTLDFFSTVLTDNGAEVIQARDGEEALALVRKEKPDLLALDLAMPGKDGGEVFEELRNDPEIADTKVCIITGRPELRRLIYERPVPPPENYLTKPVSDKDLLLNVRKVLELAEDDE